MLSHTTSHHHTLTIRIASGTMALVALWFGNMWLLAGCVVVLVFLHAYEVFAVTAMFDTLYSTGSDRHAWILTILALLFAAVAMLAQRYVRSGEVSYTL